ncbi:hypothetical protein ACIP79_40895 [Streptomyces sp. NPDC088747]|uniref:hypothetical protein n=1 Tax=Streptomyces sp. NPDC088747 TaxID=3365886 RepID=UPI00381163C5
MSSGTPAQPVVDALTELVGAQADTTGFVVLHEWLATWTGACPTCHRDILTPLRT